MKFLSILVVVFALVSCGKSKDKAEFAPYSAQSANELFSVELGWLVGPTAKEYNTAALLFKNTNHANANTVTNIVFDPQMPSMNHGTHTDDQEIVQNPDTTDAFTVNGVYFIMGGPWVVNITATVDGVRDTASIPVDVR